MQMPVTFASVVSLGVWRSFEIRLRAVVVALGKLWVLLTSNPYPIRASSSGFRGHGCFVALGLTRRSNRPAYCGRLSLFVGRVQKYSMEVRKINGSSANKMHWW